MRSNFVNDARGRLVAIEEYLDNGDIYVKDANGRLLGRYESATNMTFDAKGRLIARGDVHGSLIQF